MSSASPDPHGRKRYGWTGRLVEVAPFSVAETKRILTSRPAELDAVLAEEVRAQPQLPAGADFAEGSSAFLAGRAPRFTGRRRRSGHAAGGAGHSTDTPGTGRYDKVEEKPMARPDFPPRTLKGDRMNVADTERAERSDPRRIASGAAKPAGPLAGITVVSLEQAVAAPICTRTLGDFGARVIKVENPEGGDFARHYDDVVGGMAAHFVWVNRGKESVTLNLKDPSGMAVFHRLLDRADVMVSNLAPGATARLGIAPADLAVSHPELIAVEIDGYGPGGPLSHKRAYDLLAQAESGACATTGLPGAPAKPGPPMADVCTGLYAALSVLALLCGKERGHGRGLTAVAVSLFDTMTELMGYQLTYTLHTGVDQQPVGMGSPAVAPYGAYRTSDGQTVVLGTTNDREWQRFARDLLGRPDLADDERFRTTSGRAEHREFLDAEIADWCARHDLTQVQSDADAAGIGNARFNTPSEVIAHPHLMARDRWRRIDTPHGQVPALLPPPVIAGYEPPMGGIPALGQHTDALLTELGITKDGIAMLRAQGAVAPTPR